MKTEAGVYALVMSLKEEQTIKIGKLGTFDFGPGWYIYVGSAHGPGGVKRRTDRHRRDDERKRKKWNVDYFRPFATMHEIWFSHAPQSSEHHWAWSVMLMHGAKIPALKFGANDCYPRCDTHFFYFPSRPFLAEFHANLARHSWDVSPTYVEFVEPVESDPVSLQSPPNPGLMEYDRGRRFLDLYRRAGYDGAASAATNGTSLSFAKGTSARELIEQLAPGMGMLPAELISAAMFALAIEEIVRNCDEDVFGAIFNPNRPQTPEAVLQLSRTADTRQQYRITGVLEGRFRSVSPQDDDPVFDTVAFREVPSRLARARGAIGILDELLEDAEEQEVLAECRRLVKWCQSAAQQLQKFLTMAKVTDGDIPKKLSKDELWTKLMTRDVKGRIVGKARLALRLTIKNVWDYPEMQQRGILPTPEEKQKAAVELEQIISTAKAILGARKFE